MNDYLEDDFNLEVFKLEKKARNLRVFYSMNPVSRKEIKEFTRRSHIFFRHLKNIFHLGMYDNHNFTQKTLLHISRSIQILTIRESSE